MNKKTHDVFWMSLLSIGLFVAQPKEAYSYDWSTTVGPLKVDCAIQDLATLALGQWVQMKVRYDFRNSGQESNGYWIHDCWLAADYPNPVSCRNPNLVVPSSNGYKVTIASVDSNKFIDIPPGTGDAQKKVCSALFSRIKLAISCTNGSPVNNNVNCYLDSERKYWWNNPFGGNQVWCDGMPSVQGGCDTSRCQAGAKKTGTEKKAHWVCNGCPYGSPLNNHMNCFVDSTKTYWINNPEGGYQVWCDGMPSVQGGCDLSKCANGSKNTGSGQKAHWVCNP